ncbi:cyclic lactone autoinducer peptide [Cohnella fermenti]|uniref:Cyclic lactone autoinducer peptide n=1 Tax=Cohnella fermenti TaxID=2565925 RepID=A0A4S4BN06_9BACL|nr:cyclic lactone autoinducer peptide [Cohnella fermenti]THF76228.1 cyclic lactone autoinducer peptide [Cohnella fermenti]
MTKRIAYRIAVSLGVIATAIVSTASWIYIHQEETPAELLK